MFQTSVSRQLTEEFIQRWRCLHPDGRVISRDLNQTQLAPVTHNGSLPEIRLKKAAARSKSILSSSDTLIAELEAADEYVTGVPMHNFSIPSTAKLWIDLIAHLGKTFTGTALASFNFIEPYLRAVFAFLGVTQTTFINA